jgi:bifunctional non-homologous end joining protein LigD
VFRATPKPRQDCFTIFFAFDLLFIDGESLTEVALVERKARLKQIVPRTQTGRIRFTDHVVERGLDLFVALEAQHFEGMIGKRADSFYIAGRSKEWLKVKTRLAQPR